MSDDLTAAMHGLMPLTAVIGAEATAASAGEVRLGPGRR
jgi:hypothetical protein